MTQGPILRTPVQWGLVIALVAVLGVTVIALSRDPLVESTAAATLTEGSAPGYLAPDFTLTSTTGETVSLSDYRGQVVVLNFWATWCGPCRYEMPALQRVSQELNGPAVVLGVNQGEDAAEITRFAATVGVDYPLLLDSDSATNRRYRVRALPTTLFIDANGVIQDQIAGVASQAVIQEKAERLLP